MLINNAKNKTKHETPKYRLTAAGVQRTWLLCFHHLTEEDQAVLLLWKLRMSDIHSQKKKKKQDYLRFPCCCNCKLILFLQCLSKSKNSLQSNQSHLRVCLLKAQLWANAGTKSSFLVIGTTQSATHYKLYSPFNPHSYNPLFYTLRCFIHVASTPGQWEKDWVLGENVDMHET